MVCPCHEYDDAATLNVRRRARPHNPVRCFVYLVRAVAKPTEADGAMSTQPERGSGPDPGLDEVMSERRRLINLAYDGLHGVVELTERQIKYYTTQYFSFIRPDFVTLVADREGKLAAFGITMPSLSVALQKARGKLLPMGFLHLLKALRKNSVGDMYLVAVRPDLQGKGVNAILMKEITQSYIRHGILWAESNPELETNRQVQAIWRYYKAHDHKRRRCFIKMLN